MDALFDPFRPSLSLSVPNEIIRAMAATGQLQLIKFGTHHVLIKAERDVTRRNMRRSSLESPAAKWSNGADM